MWPHGDIFIVVQQLQMLALRPDKWPPKPRILRRVTHVDDNAPAGTGEDARAYIATIRIEVSLHGFGGENSEFAGVGWRLSV
jgi:hypothetical protein